MVLWPHGIKAFSGSNSASYSLFSFPTLLFKEQMASSSRHVIDEQPRRTPQMRKPKNRRNVLNKEFDSNGLRDWSYSLFNCFGENGASTCLIAWICPCIIFNLNKTRLEHLETDGSAHPLGGDAFGHDCYYYCLLFACCGCGCIIQKRLRGRIRKRYSIRGSDSSDTCASWCCPPCELTQSSKELYLEERSLVKSG